MNAVLRKIRAISRNAASIAIDLHSVRAGSARLRQGEFASARSGAYPGSLLAVGTMHRSTSSVCSRSDRPTLGMRECRIQGPRISSSDMTTWLPSLPFEALTAEAVEAFLAQGHPESAVLEYKERASAKNLPEVIAAFANTHGGLVIVGVPDPWDGDFNRLVDVDENDLSSLQDRLVDVLSPPWVPPMKRVDIHGRHTGIIKVDPMRAPRPVLVAGSAKFRARDRNTPMTVDQLGALLAQTHRMPVLPNVTSWSPTSRQTQIPVSGGRLLLLVRAAGGLPSWPGTLRNVTMGKAFREQLKRDLDASDLQATVAWVGSTQVSDVTTWRPTPPSRSQIASFGLASKSDNSNRRAAAHVVVDLTQTPHSGGVMVWTDLAVWRSRRDTSDRTGHDFDLQDIRRLLTATMLSVRSTVAVCEQEIPRDVIAGASPQIEAWLSSSRELTQVIDLDSAGSIVVQSETLGNTRHLDPLDAAPALSEAPTRIVDTWIDRMILDSGRLLKS